MSNTPIEEGSAKPVNYSGYLEIDRLLDLQHPRSEGPEHDELLFIVIHQVYELWFKQVLHETTFLQRALEQDDVSRILPTFKRILTIFKTLVAQVDILETMTPTSFNSFRHRLDSASGFQSYQFREFEFRLGHKRKAMVVHHPEGSAGRAALERAFAEPALWDSFLRFLAARGYELP